jgi:hypothetical protein
MGAGAFYGLDAVLAAWWPWAKEKLDAVPKPIRRRIEAGLIMLAILYAGFEAWSDEHRNFMKERDARIVAEGRAEASAKSYSNNVTIVEGLKNFYTVGSRLLKDGMFTVPVGGEALWSGEVDGFEHSLREWVGAKLGEGASYRLDQYSISPETGFGASISNEHSERLKKLMILTKNIDSLLENPNWGQPPNAPATR